MKGDTIKNIFRNHKWHYNKLIGGIKYFSEKSNIDILKGQIHEDVKSLLEREDVIVTNKGYFRQLNNELIKAIFHSLKKESIYYSGDITYLIEDNFDFLAHSIRITDTCKIGQKEIKDMTTFDKDTYNSNVFHTLENYV